MSKLGLAPVEAKVLIEQCVKARSNIKARVEQLCSDVWDDYRSEVREYNALPFYKRWFSCKPTSPSSQNCLGFSEIDIVSGTFGHSLGAIRSLIRVASKTDGCVLVDAQTYSNLLSWVNDSE